MPTNYSKFDMYMDAIDTRARELAAAKINAERTSGQHLKFWEEVMETEDNRLAAIVEMAVCDGESKLVMDDVVNHFVARWEKNLREEKVFVLPR